MKRLPVLALLFAVLAFPLNATAQFGGGFGGGGFGQHNTPDKLAEGASLGGWVRMDQVYNRVWADSCDFRFELESQSPDEGVLTYITPTFIQFSNANADAIAMSASLGAGDIDRLASKHLIDPRKLQYAKGVYASPILNGKLTVEIAGDGFHRAVSSYTYSDGKSWKQNEFDISKFVTVLVRCSNGIAPRIKVAEESLQKHSENLVRVEDSISRIYQMLRQAIITMRRSSR
ncbi:MAG: hypothetical protein J5J00_15515 [Deltaproteobacteria bacterium]|nr:hypothetical protein [Deltaproteobacteria bacterium]